MDEVNQESTPIFTIQTADREIRIYANGVVEGIDEPYTITNYIPFFTIENREIARFCKPYRLPYAGVEKSSSSAEGASQGTPLFAVIRSSQAEDATGEK